MATKRKFNNKNNIFSTPEPKRKHPFLSPSMFNTPETPETPRILNIPLTPITPNSKDYLIYTEPTEVLYSMNKNNYNELEHHYNYNSHTRYYRNTNKLHLIFYPTIFIRDQNMNDDNSLCDIYMIGIGVSKNLDTDEVHYTKKVHPIVTEIIYEVKRLNNNNLKQKNNIHQDLQKLLNNKIKKNDNTTFILLYRTKKQILNSAIDIVKKRYLKRNTNNINLHNNNNNNLSNLQPVASSSVTSTIPRFVEIDLNLNNIQNRTNSNNINNFNTNLLSGSFGNIPTQPITPTHSIKLTQKQAQTPNFFNNNNNNNNSFAGGSRKNKTRKNKKRKI